MRTTPALFAIWLCACIAPEEVDSDTSAASDTSVASDTDTDTDTAVPLSWAADVYRPFFAESCGGCHREGTFFTPYITEDPSRLISGRSLYGEGMSYVTPGSLEESFLWYKVTDRTGEFASGGTRMPPPPAAALTSEAIAAVEAWILGGAAP